MKRPETPPPGWTPQVTTKDKLADLVAAAIDPANAVIPIPWHENDDIEVDYFAFPGGIAYHGIGVVSIERAADGSIDVVYYAVEGPGFAEREAWLATAARTMIEGLGGKLDV